MEICSKVVLPKRPNIVNFDNYIKEITPLYWTYKVNFYSEVTQEFHLESEIKRFYPQIKYIFTRIVYKMVWNKNIWKRASESSQIKVKIKNYN